MRARVGLRKRELCGPDEFRFRGREERKQTERLGGPFQSETKGHERK